MSIKAIFPAGVTTLTVNGLHQWDYGQTLDIEAPDLPLLVEVHFACSGMDEAVVRLCEVTDGKTSAAIPDVCLEQRSPVVAWVYEIEEAGGKTILTVNMPVIARIKPPAGPSSPQVADQYAQLIAIYEAQMTAIANGEAPVGRAFEADHASEADRAAEAVHAATADHAARATVAAEANKANAYVGVLPVENGGTGADSVEGAWESLGFSLCSRIELGSYTGTGQGSVTITLPFEAKFIAFSSKVTTYGEGESAVSAFAFLFAVKGQTEARVQHTGSSRHMVDVNWGGSSVTLTQDTYHDLCGAGNEYVYCAMG